MVKKYRIFGGKKYKRLSSWAISGEQAQKEKRGIKQTFPEKKVRVVWSGVRPHIYPRGRFWVYYSRGKEGKTF